VDWLGVTVSPQGLVDLVAGGVVAGVTVGMFMVFVSLFYGRR